MNEDEFQKKALAHLAETTASLTTIVNKLSYRFDGQAKDIEYVQHTLKDVRGAIAKLVKVLHEGNGERPIITRVALVEQDQADLRRDFQTWRREAFETSKIARKGKWGVITALATGVVSLITTLVSALL